MWFDRESECQPLKQIKTHNQPIGGLDRLLCTVLGINWYGTFSVYFLASEIVSPTTHVVGATSKLWRLDHVTIDRQKLVWQNVRPEPRVSWGWWVRGDGCRDSRGSIAPGTWAATSSHCTVLYCIVLYSYCTALYCIVLYCTVLYCIVLYCTVLHRYSTRRPSTWRPGLVPTPWPSPWSAGVWAWSPVQYSTSFA